MSKASKAEKSAKRSAINDLKKNFQQSLQGEGGELHLVDFPEITFPVYARKDISAQRKSTILNALKFEGLIPFCAQVLINGLLDETGTYVFTKADVHDLMSETSSSVVERASGEICKIIFGDDNPERILARHDSDGGTMSAEEAAAIKN